jgi:DNA-directed RNA polymerase subunit omega
MARVTVEDCVDKVPTVSIWSSIPASAPASLSGGAEPFLERDRDKNPVVALREIAAKSMKPDEVKEEYIRSLQKHAEVDEPEEAPRDEDVGREDAQYRQVTEEELLRALTTEAQRRAEPQPEPEADYEE